MRCHPKQKRPLDGGRGEHRTVGHVATCSPFITQYARAHRYRWDGDGAPRFDQRRFASEGIASVFPLPFPPHESFALNGMGKGKGLGKGVFRRGCTEAAM